MYKNFIVTILAIGLAVGIGLYFRKSPNTEPVVSPDTSTPEPVVETPTENPVNNFAKFGVSLKLKVGENLTFSDGLKITLVKINDSRCKPDVQCFWAGELGTTFEISGGKLATSQTIYMGAETNKSFGADGYVINLDNVTEKDASVTVSYTQP